MEQHVELTEHERESAKSRQQNKEGTRREEQEHFAAERASLRIQREIDGEKEKERYANMEERRQIGMVAERERFSHMESMRQIIREIELVAESSGKIRIDMQQMQEEEEKKSESARKREEAKIMEGRTHEELCEQRQNKQKRLWEREKEKLRMQLEEERGDRERDRERARERERWRERESERERERDAERARERAREKEHDLERNLEREREREREGEREETANERARENTKSEQGWKEKEKLWIVDRDRESARARKESREAQTAMAAKVSLLQTQVPLCSQPFNPLLRYMHTTSNLKHPTWQTHLGINHRSACSLPCVIFLFSLS